MYTHRSLPSAMWVRRPLASTKGSLATPRGPAGAAAEAIAKEGAPQAEGKGISVSERNAQRDGTVGPCYLQQQARERRCATERGQRGPKRGAREDSPMSNKWLVIFKGCGKPRKRQRTLAGSTGGRRNCPEYVTPRRHQVSKVMNG